MSPLKLYCFEPTLHQLFRDQGARGCSVACKCVCVIGNSLQKFGTQISIPGWFENRFDDRNTILGNLWVSIFVLEGDVPSARTESEGRGVGNALYSFIQTLSALIAELGQHTLERGLEFGLLRFARKTPLLGGEERES